MDNPDEYNWDISITYKDDTSQNQPYRGTYKQMNTRFFSILNVHPNLKKVFVYRKADSGLIMTASFVIHE